MAASSCLVGLRDTQRKSRGRRKEPKIRACYIHKHRVSEKAVRIVSRCSPRAPIRLVWKLESVASDSVWAPVDVVVKDGVTKVW